MKYITLVIPIAVFTALLTVSCQKKESVTEPVTEYEHSNPHQEVLDSFQNSQKSFKKLIAQTVDAETFDKALPNLNKLVASINSNAEALTKLTPPGIELQKHIRSSFEEVNKATQPTGGEMMIFLSIEEREDKMNTWFKSFVKAGQRFGAEFNRLYNKDE